MTQPTRQAYWDERLSQHWGLHGVGMLIFGKNYNAWLYRVRAAVFRRTLKKLGLDLRTAVVLDIGSGTGFFIEQWKKFSPKQIVGVDIAPFAVEQLKLRFPNEEFHQLDVGLSIPEKFHEVFDVASAIDVLFHIPNDEAYRTTFENLYTCVKPGGVLIFTEAFLQQTPPQQGQYWRGRSRTEIEDILHQVGFTILSRRPWNYLMSAPSDAPPSLRKLWERLTRYLYGRERLGWLVGAILYPIEWLLTRLAAESPATEIMMCRKPH